MFAPTVICDEFTGVSANVLSETSLLKVIQVGRPVCPFSFKTIVEFMLQAVGPVQERIAGNAVFEASLTVAIKTYCDGVSISFVAIIAFAGMSQSRSVQSQVAGLTMKLNVLLIEGYGELPKLVDNEVIKTILCVPYFSSSEVVEVSLY